MNFVQIHKVIPNEFLNYWNGKGAIPQPVRDSSLYFHYLQADKDRISI
ncbi:hypothetical protein [Bacillus weihaiensis]|nr:hypothetical protein [Bacillus weihaiensis]